VNRPAGVGQTRAGLRAVSLVSGYGQTSGGCSGGSYLNALRRLTHRQAPGARGDGRVRRLATGAESQAWRPASRITSNQERHRDPLVGHIHSDAVPHHRRAVHPLRCGRCTTPSTTHPNDRITVYFDRRRCRPLRECALVAQIIRRCLSRALRYRWSDTSDQRPEAPTTILAPGSAPCRWMPHGARRST